MLSTFGQSPHLNALSYNSSSEEEVVLVHVQFSCRLHDPDTHLEAEEQLVDFKQTSTRVPTEADAQNELHHQQIRRLIMIRKKLFTVV